MAKGFFTQGVSLLTAGRVPLDAIRAALVEQGFTVGSEVPASGNWAFGGPALTVSFRPEVNGYVAVNVVEHPWPDGMGNPQTDPLTFGAWSMGYFGPLAFPGNLARAGQHSWSWEPGRTIFSSHSGIIRLQTSYVFGRDDQAQLFPPDHDPVGELMFLSRLVLALLSLPGVLCYFNANGEVLRDDASFREIWDGCAAEQKLPLSLWSNVRFFRLNDRLFFMDTVGNGQLDRRDVEAFFLLADYDPGVIDYYLRNVTHYLLDHEDHLNSGDRIDGPGERNLTWTMDLLDRGLSDPPRRVVRLYSRAIAAEVAGFLAPLGQ